MTGIGVTILLILNPEIGVGDVAIKDVLTILGIGFQISGLNLFAKELDILGCKELLDKTHVAILNFLWELLLLDLTLKDVQQMYRVGSHFR